MNVHIEPESLPATDTGYPNSGESLTKNEPFVSVNSGTLVSNQPQTLVVVQPETKVSSLSKHTPKLIPIEDIIYYVEKNLTYREIGEILDCTPENVCQRLKDANYTPERIERYKKNRANILAHIGSKIANKININLDVDVNNTKDVLNLALAHSKLYGDERLERGQATEIVDMSGLTREYEDAKRQLEEYERREHDTIDISSTTEVATEPTTKVAVVPRGTHDTIVVTAPSTKVAKSLQPKSGKSKPKRRRGGTGRTQTSCIE